MRAAQNLADHLTSLTADVPAELGHLIDGLPGWLRAGVVAVVVLVLVVRISVPPLLRAIDDHRLANTARRCITRGEDWVEVLRIRNTPRRWIGRQPPPDTPPGQANESGSTPPETPAHRADDP